MSEWLFQTEPAQEGLFKESWNGIKEAAARFRKRDEPNVPVPKMAKPITNDQIKASDPLYRKPIQEIVKFWFTKTDQGKAFLDDCDDDPFTKTKLGKEIVDYYANAPKGQKPKTFTICGVHFFENFDWDDSLAYSAKYDFGRVWKGTSDKYEICYLNLDDLYHALSSEGITPKIANESWLFDDEPMDPAQEANAFNRMMAKIGSNKTVSRLADNNLKYVNSKSRISTDQRKVFNANIKTYIASHDPGEIARLAAQLYSKRKGYVTGDAGKKACEGIAKRQTSRKAKNVTIEMMNGLYYVTCTKVQEGGNEEFMFYCPLVNGVYSRTIHQMAWELVGSQGKAAYATESWIFD